ncbi:uncharacterized protein EDB91DRAFT_1345885, partial [Suillus paluster]|uniref:uncharacterized protein n=1 Tax=Suillus paluster TaxID=48578 RepID=UPI001B881E84
MNTDQTGVRFLCVCTKYNRGQPHEVSYTSWYRHLNEATTEEEKQKMHTAKAFGLKVLPISDPSVQASGSSGHPVPSTGGLEDVPAGDVHDMSLSASARRAATLRALAKRARESADSQRFVGRRKRAKTEV